MYNNEVVIIVNNNCNWIDILRVAKKYKEVEID